MRVLQLNPQSENIIEAVSYQRPFSQSLKSDAISYFRSTIMLKTNLFSSKPTVISGFLPEVHSYGFNGKEKENEHTSGNYDFGARILDTRLGRWLSVDKINKPSLSSYQFGKNSPLIFKDADGNDEHLFFHDYDWYIKNGQYTIWNDGKNSFKVPTADKIIKDGKEEITYYMCTASEVRYEETTIVCDTKMVFSCEEIKQEAVKEFVASSDFEKGDPLVVTSCEVMAATKDVDGRAAVSIMMKQVKHDKNQMNSPMTLSGGDSQVGLKSTTSDILSIDRVAGIVNTWKQEVRYGTSYPLKVGIDGLRAMAGNTDAKAASFKDASKSGGVFDFKSTLGLQQGKLYEINDVLYNANEAGNFCFGYAAASCGFLKAEVKAAAASVLTGGRKLDEPWEEKAYEKGMDKHNSGGK